MSRACVIVLDAVGAGELPDASEYGDVGADTLGNIAKRSKLSAIQKPTSLESRSLARRRFGSGSISPR